jgi:hypothetical protein
MRPTDLSKHERTDLKFAALSHVRVCDGVSGYKYEDILLRLHFIKLNLRETHKYSLSANRGWQGMWYAWERREKCTRFWRESPKENSTHKTKT